jgi:hypothetical protein
MKKESEFILLPFSLVVVGESELFSIGDLAQRAVAVLPTDN